MQFDAFHSLLEDPSHIVRSLLAFGVCKISAVCCRECIPAEVVKTLLTSLIQKHAWDGSNNEVRLPVIKGFAFMVDYRLSHTLLQTARPKLCQLIHDKVDRVRLAVTDLLLKVKTLRAIKFWTLVPLSSARQARGGQFHGGKAACTAAVQQLHASRQAT